MAVRVLCVDGDRDILLLLEEMLRDRYEVTTCTSPQLALQEISTKKPQLILIETAPSPESEGAALVRRLKQDPRYLSIPVIAFTAHAMRGDREKFLQIGFDDYFAKPVVDEGALFQMIRRAVGLGEDGDRVKAAP